ncbi:hypothetical protein MPTK1_7g19010 [Marchantia polymorpha subsp. ruderalis]|uniref:RING-type domain-containing protein n=2 Tax=Marchantia polymorpha TaxID=3197 RepID=A0AAF6C1A2_MARPO|nr:hypothetical protein MARPO_0067s0077 [Marchantia polymorpha]BBN18036.1 hypothetical protein Mp_7g19010 [Marchantia polymorpha subsp. ruderalis]|eukprot:PTQ36000.1 hypothetical protein MARPO_0067s0077 [Marchantia polymorpha]
MEMGKKDADLPPNQFSRDRAAFWKEWTHLQSSVGAHHQKVMEFFHNQTAYLLKLECMIIQQAAQLEKHKTKQKSAVNAVGVFLQREDSYREALKAALEALEEEKEKHVCQICMTKPRNILIMPCMHLLYCDECLRKHLNTSNLCPVCRGTMKTWIPCRFNLD